MADLIDLYEKARLLNLQNLAHGSTLVVVGSLQNLHRAGSIGGHGTGEEVSASTEAEFSRTEGVFHRAVRA